MYARSLTRTWIRVSAAALAVCCAAAAAAPGPKPATGSSTDSPEIGTGRDTLRQIVQERCVVNWSQNHLAAPCERVYLADSKTGASGYAVLADRKGGAHYLLIPTPTMAGVDGRELLDPESPNYFAEAWQARDLLARFVGHEIARTAVGLAVNTARARSQDQFHIHVECVRPDVVAALRTASERIGESWGPLDVVGSTYDALRIAGTSLDGANPFELLATLKPEARRHIGDYTLVVIGMDYRSGPGFVLLTGTGPTGELLLDSACAVAGADG